METVDHRTTRLIQVDCQEALDPEDLADAIEEEVNAGNYKILQEEQNVTIYLEFPRLRCPYCGGGPSTLLDAETDRFDSGHILEFYVCGNCGKQFQVELNTTLKGVIVPE